MTFKATKNQEINQLYTNMEKIKAKIIFFWLSKKLAILY